MAFQKLLPIFLFLFLQPDITYALQSNSTRFEFDLNTFSGVLRRGDNAKLVHELKKHLMNLGYLYPNNLGNKHNFDRHLEHAVKKYQKFFRLNVTGVVDVNTLKLIRKPRCGVPDFFSPQTHFKSLFAFYEGFPRWGKTTLKYYLFPTVRNAYRPPIQRALQEWESETPFRFYQVNNPATEGVDIRVSFEKGDHGDANPFIPYGGATAHSLRPPYGILHFNAEQRWGWDGHSSTMDLQTIALHEFGHILGLEHSSFEQAVMYPHTDYGEIKHLDQDDIVGIKTLYGF